MTRATGTWAKWSVGVAVVAGALLAVALWSNLPSAAVTVSQSIQQEGASPEAAPQQPAWPSPFVNRRKLDSPLVEVTPFAFNDRLYLLENWQKHWELPGSRDGARFQEDEVRVRDVETGEIVSVALVGHGLGMAFLWEGRVHVFAGDWGNGKEKWKVQRIRMVHSEDLRHWSEPVTVLEAEPGEGFYNVSVCRDAQRFIMLVESDDSRWPAFTFKYFASTDMLSWEPLPGALYGTDKYVGGPALYFEDGWYYTLYLQHLPPWRFETRITRSRDLVTWEDAPLDRPFLAPDPRNRVHPIRSGSIRECNASDAEVVHWRDKTLVYFTGGDQHVAGDLQCAEFNGAPRELFEQFFP